MLAASLGEVGRISEFSGIFLFAALHLLAMYELQTQ
jgi:hypothetical protein